MLSCKILILTTNIIMCFIQFLQSTLDLCKKLKSIISQRYNTKQLIKSIFYSVVSGNYVKIYETFIVMQQNSLEILIIMTYCLPSVYNHYGYNLINSKIDLIS